MNKVIVTTTICPPREALHKYDEVKDSTLIVAGDHKTPGDFRLNNGIYLSPADQEKITPKLSELIGWNSIQRRNFAFLMVHKLNAGIIATIADDLA
jgi:hypothetical protein